jgi:hypothetical protein
MRRCPDASWREGAAGATGQPLRIEAERECVEIAVEHFALLVGQCLERDEQLVELLLVELVAEVDEAFAQRVPARVLAEHQLRAREADVLRTHDLVGLAVLEHAVLVNAGFMRERVLADNALLRGIVAPTRSASRRAVGYSSGVRMPVSNLKRSERVFSAITISSSAALPARSPMPLIVHSTWRAPAASAARLLATPRPRSLWQCALSMTLSMPRTSRFRRANSAPISSGVV